MKKAKKYIRIVFIVLILSILLKPMISSWLLESRGIYTCAILTKEKTRVRYQKSTLLYQYSVGDVMYRGNSNIEDWSIAGDSICILYLDILPEISRPVKFIGDKSECNCK